MSETIINGIIEESQEVTGQLQYARGEKGNDGVGISDISKTSTEGKVDTYTITLTDGTTKIFTVTNGDDGTNGISVSDASINASGHLIVTLSDGTSIDAGVAKGDSGVYIGTTPPTDPSIKVWIDTSGEAGDVEMTSNKVTSISSESTDTQYPSAKAVAKAVSTEQNRADNTYANALKGTKSGSAILIDDVSPVTHNMGVKISSNTVTDLTAVKVKRCGKNLLNLQGRTDAQPTGNWPISKYDVGHVIYRGFAYSGYYQLSEEYKCDVNVDGSTITVIQKVNNYGIGYLIKCRPNTQYIFSATTDLNGFFVRFIDKDGNKIDTGNWGKIFTTTSDTEYIIICLYNTTAGTFTIENPQLELGTTATDYEPYKECAEYTPTADGVVEGVTSLYPNTTLTTDTDGVLIDCEYNKDINIVLKPININTWKDIQDSVRAGFGHIRFPVGYEFTTRDSVTGADIIWVVRAHDHHTAANNKLTHTMTLETKNVYSLSNGAQKEVQYDATEAFYFAELGLAAGTYNITIANQNWYTADNGKTFQFELTKALPVGGQLVFAMTYDATLEGESVKSYANNTTTTALETVTLTEGSEGTSLGTTNGSSPNVNHMHRAIFGSNNYAQSAVRQWLNSAAVAGSVWTPTNVFDRPASWATSYNGFMHGLPTDFLKVVETAVIPCRTNSICECASLDGTEFTINKVYSLKDKFFLLSRPEIYGDWDDSSYKDGELMEYYEGFTNTERIKYDAAGTARIAWLRSPNPSSTYNARIVHPSGVVNNTRAYYSNGVAPACIIA